MGIDIYTCNEDTDYATFVFVQNTSDVAFGPVFHGSREDGEEFKQFCPQSVTCYSDEKLEALYHIFKQGKELEHLCKDVGLKVIIKEE